MPPLPALNVRVANPANALLQAEQILGARAQRNALVSQQKTDQQLGNLFAKADLSDPTVRQQVQQKSFAIGGANAGAQVQQMFAQMSAQERAQLAQETQTVARSMATANDPASYAQARAQLQQAGVDISKMPETYDPNFVTQSVNAARSIEGILAEQQPQFTQVGNQIVRIQGGEVTPVFTAPPPAPTPRTPVAEINADLANGLVTPAQAMIMAQQALSPGETWRPITDAERGMFQIPEGQAAQVSERTGKVATIGSAGVEVNITNDLTTKTQGRLEGEILDTQDAISRIERIRNSFDPTFQQFFPRLGIKWDQMVARFGELDPQSRQRVEARAVFQQNAIENVNSTIRALTGAQMSQFEAERITSQLPNPGTGLFDGDDPVTFEAKMTNALESLRAVLARRAYADATGKEALTTGFDLTTTVREIVNTRGTELEETFKAQGLKDEELSTAIRDRLRIEFGGLLRGG